MSIDNNDIKIKEASKSKMRFDNENSKLAKFFGFKKFNTTLKKEIIGGISTLLAMIYILSVEPEILKYAPSVDGGAKLDGKGVFLATAIIAFAATFVMGMVSNIPVALAPSMGVNAMFTYSVAMKGIGYQGALFATMISGVLFCIISISNVRKMLIKALPKSLHIAIGLGIGFFIAYVGVANIGWVKIGDENTEISGLPVATLNNFKVFYPAIIIGTLVLLGAVVLHFKKFVAPIAVMMLAGFIIAVILANVLPNNDVIKNSFGTAKFNSNWEYKSMFNGFVNNIKSTFNNAGNLAIWKSPTMYISIFVFTILTFFDATGTLTSVMVESNKNSPYEREIPKSAMIIDGGSTIFSSFMAISHNAVYAESCVGISQGARTGFSSIVTSIGLLLSIALSPLFTMLPSCISGAATVFIGIIMISNITEIEWKKPEISLASFFIILFMIITYNIAVGIGLGLITYTIGCLATKKVKEVHPIIWVLDVVFIAYFIAFAFIQ
ncbi:NCS2 family permease [Spiroplasma tabanidicola]|uniref:Xanthine/uracil permease n=1 Tax=Spiroplasma tabanidicola TaxID=324079 RepID=A0A6I6CJ85_9MOLU|nr:NCS2 family permease [Spiroplasma tabanidicola]QGS52133.1 xanthine/uracil permease [Spiroplasma tabanidicola]